jgi:enoyl-CoA hydratase/carnithine racemase
MRGQQLRRCPEREGEVKVRRLEWSELVDLCASPVGLHDLRAAHGQLLVVARPGRPPAADELRGLLAGVAALPAVVVLDADDGDELGGAASVADVVADGDDLDAAIARAAAAPVAATALALLLRASEHRPVADGLVAESSTYSTLQAGPEFAAWRDAHPPRRRPARTEPSVRIERDGDELRISLDRPEVRNALDARMRDELWDALLIARAEPTLRVTWRGLGPAFCAGGDLDEFGSRPDPATGHLVRLARSLGLLLHELSERVTVELHGACAGSGIELPSFAGRVVAAPDTAVSLPELALGLVPGAGGTVSLPRRIGRHRTAWLAFTGRTVDAATALDWGLVDAVERG